MIENVMKLKLLLSSPGNLDEERELVDKVVQNINYDSGRREGFVIELVRWETHTWPDVGEYSQDVINQQFPKDIHIFVGILGSYFGTPTPNFGSGTEEEFQVAFDAFKAKGFPKVMFYFHDPSSRLSELNLKQVSRVQDFKEKIGNAGVYYWMYKERTDLSLLLQRHINSTISSFLKDLRADNQSDKEGAEEVELSFLSNYDSLVAGSPFLIIEDLAEAATDDMKSHNKALVLLSEETKRIAQKISAATKRIINAHRASDLKQIERAGGDVHVALRRFRKQLRSNIPVLKVGVESSFLKLQRIISLAEMNHLSEIVGLQAVIDSAEEASNAIIQLAESANNLKQQFDLYIVDGELDAINNEVRRLSALITDLLEYAAMVKELHGELKSQT